MSTTAPESQSAGATKGGLFGRDALNLPNAITVSRLVLAGILFALIDYEGYWITATVLFVIAAATDFLDGYLARKYGQVTMLGRILDPFADKIIVSGAFLFLLARQQTSGVTAWMVVVIIGREMFMSTFRSFIEQLGHDFSANWAGKLKMILQCVAISACLLSLSPDLRSERFLLLRDVLLWVTVIVTAWSGLLYLFEGSRLLASQSNA